MQQSNTNHTFSNNCGHSNLLINVDMIAKRVRIYITSFQRKDYEFGPTLWKRKVGRSMQWFVQLKIKGPMNFDKEYLIFELSFVL